MTDTTTETRDLIARVRDGIVPADQPQTLHDLARTADGEPRADAVALEREAEIVEIRQCIERADRHGPTNRFGDDRTLLTALDTERAENDRLRARVAELEEQVKEAVVRLARVPDMLDRERREGAEAMRERAAAHAERYVRRWSARYLPESIRALPLDDDAREDAQGDDNGR